MAYSETKLNEIKTLVDKVGKEEAATVLGISTETIRKYLSYLKNGKFTEQEVKSELVLNGSLKKISEIYTPDELRAIANGGRILPGIEKVPIISFEGQHIRIGVITDTHIGHQKFSENRLFQAFDEFKKQNVDFITHSGDVTEGMSHRPGHIYELDHLGYEAQKEYAIKLFGQWTYSPIYAIDGNHDRWYIKSNGALIVKDIDRALPNFHFIGHDEGDISLKGKATLKLWHGEDGNSYALSYRLQKLIESLSGGEKPDALIAGHTHKMVYIFERNVHTMSCGSICAQTSWMRGKKIAAHVGFNIIDIWVGEKGISKFQNCWYPFYC